MMLLTESSLWGVTSPAVWAGGRGAARCELGQGRVHAQPAARETRARYRVRTGGRRPRSVAFARRRLRVQSKWGILASRSPGCRPIPRPSHCPRSQKSRPSHPTRKAAARRQPPPSRRSGHGGQTVHGAGAPAGGADRRRRRAPLRSRSAALVHRRCDAGRTSLPPPRPRPQLQEAHDEVVRQVLGPAKRAWAELLEERPWEALAAFLRAVDWTVRAICSWRGARPRGARPPCLHAGAAAAPVGRPPHAPLPLPPTPPLLVQEPWLLALLGAQAVLFLSVIAMRRSTTYLGAVFVFGGAPRCAPPAAAPAPAAARGSRPALGAPAGEPPVCHSAGRART